MTENPVTDSRLRVRDIFTLVLLTSVLAFLAQCGEKGTQAENSYFQAASIPVHGY